MSAAGSKTWLIWGALALSLGLNAVLVFSGRNSAPEPPKPIVAEQRSSVAKHPVEDSLPPLAPTRSDASRPSPVLLEAPRTQVANNNYLSVPQPSTSTAVRPAISSSAPASSKSGPLKAATQASVNPVNTTASSEQAFSGGAPVGSNALEVSMPVAAPGQFSPMVPASMVSPPAGVPVNPVVEKQIESLAQEFVDQVRETGGESSLDAWNSAQLANDEKFRAIFGQDAFVKRNLQGGQQQATNP